MINKIKQDNTNGLFYRKQWLLSSFVLLTLSQNICGKSINESELRKDITIGSSPKIITLQTFKDWSSRLGTNQTTPQTTSLVFEESKEVRTTDYGSKQNILMTSTENTINDLKDTQTTVPQTENITESNQINAHNIAAQVLSRILHITPLLALASNGVPYRRVNYSSKGYQSDESKINEIDVDSDVNNFKAERMSASGISFPTTPPTTTEFKSLSESPPTESPTDPIDFAEYVSQSDDPQYNDGDNHDHNDEQDDDEPAASEFHEDYEDDEELESFRYPVKVNYQDSEEDNNGERDTSPPFVMPNIDLNPESLKQKGCRTVVKEVQAIPVLKTGLPGKPNPNPINGITRTKRNSDGNSRKFTSIVMTKECHFPGDEGASSEESPLTVATTATSDSKQDMIFQTPNPISYDDYDEDFDFMPQLSYASRGMDSDKMEPKSSNDRKSYADNPVFRRDNSEYVPKDDFGFDDSGFYDFKDESDEEKPRKKVVKNEQKIKKTKQKMSSSPSNDYEDPSFDDEDFGATPKRKPKAQQKRPPLYGNERGRGGNRQKKGRKKPKKINRSFAFFRRAEPKDKDPNESDFSVSYGRGNFQSFSDSYDSDKDGPRKGKGKTRSKSYD